MAVVAVDNHPLRQITFTLPFGTLIACSFCYCPFEETSYLDCSCCATCDSPECICCSTCGCKPDECECCTECESYPCECCDICGSKPSWCDCCHTCNNKYCTCCYVCGNDSEYCGCCTDCENVEGECECSGQNGYAIAEAPWSQRGIHVHAYNTTRKWREVWDIDYNNIDPVQAAGDYYVLEALSHNIPNRTLFTPKPRLRDFLGGLDGYNKWSDSEYLVNRSLTNTMFDNTLDSICAAAKQRLEHLVAHLTPSFANYCNMAISGELRHHRAIGGTVLNHRRSSAWVGWKEVLEKVGVQALKDAAELFRDFTNDGYGGELWAQASERLYEFLSGDPHMPAHIFVDRVFNLEHNGGCFLNKIEWAVNNDCGWNLYHLTEKVLPAHADLPTKWNILLGVASQGTRDLWNEYWEITNMIKLSLGETPVDNPIGGLISVCRNCYKRVGEGHTLYCHAHDWHTQNVPVYVVIDPNDEDHEWSLEHTKKWKSVWDDDWNMISDPDVCVKFVEDLWQGAVLSDEMTIPLSSLPDVIVPSERACIKVEIYVMDPDHGRMWITAPHIGGPFREGETLWSLRERWCDGRITIKLLESIKAGVKDLVKVGGE